MNRRLPLGIGIHRIRGLALGLGMLGPLSILPGCRNHDFPEYPANYREFAYVTNGQDNTVSAYIIDCDGYLSPVAGSPFPTGGFPFAIAITK